MRLSLQIEVDNMEGVLALKWSIEQNKERLDAQVPSKTTKEGASLELVRSGVERIEELEQFMH